MANGAKYGVVEGIKRNLDPSEPSPNFNNDDAFAENAIMVVISLSATIIALYITAIVVGSMSKATASQLPLTNAWNSTMTSLDSQAGSSFSLAAILPIAIVGVGILVVVISAFSMQ